MMSGVTDCYQPAERHFRLTRQCIEVASEFRQPLNIITKNALVTRDIDLLAPMAADNLARVAISLTSLDQSLTRVLATDSVTDHWLLTVRSSSAQAR